MRLLKLFFVAAFLVVATALANGSADAKDPERVASELNSLLEPKTYSLTAAERRKAKRKRAAKRKKYRKKRSKIRRANRARAKARKRRIARKKAAAKRAKLYARAVVPYRSKQKPGTIVIETGTRHLYYVLRGGKAIRYGVAVGKQGFSWSGTSRIRRKVKWPTWTPPKEMIERKPELAKYAKGQPGGPDNPLGARALYLFQGKRDTLYRIHGTNSPRSIGRAASSGCIRMKNEDVTHLYSLARMGTKVIVR